MHIEKVEYGKQPEESIVCKSSGNNLILHFPPTDVVTCAFTFRTANSNRVEGSFDKLGRMASRANAQCAKRYYYRVPKGLLETGKVCVGAMVVVFCQTGYQICEVTEINATSPGPKEQLAWVVDVVNTRAFALEFERQEQLEHMKRHLKEERDRLEKLITYELIAEKNPEFGAMLQAFKDMGGSF